MSEVVIDRAMPVIICDQCAMEVVVAHLRSVGVRHLTATRGTQRTGETGRREGSAVWPGENALILSCLPECQVADVVKDLRKLHDARPQHTMPLRVFCLPAQDPL